MKKKFIFCLPTSNVVEPDFEVKWSVNGLNRIAIIGMGAAGVSVLNAIARNEYYHLDQIVLYDQTQTFGTGTPYQPDSEILLINQTADTMSLDPTDSLDFVK